MQLLHTHSIFLLLSIFSCVCARASMFVQVCVRVRVRVRVRDRETEGKCATSPGTKHQKQKVCP